MNNQSTELQKTDSKESLTKKVVLDTTTKTISTSIVEGGKYFILFIISGTSIGSSVIGFIAGLPIFLYIPLGALVFCFVALGFYVFSFRRANKLLLTENKSLKGELENKTVPRSYTSEEKALIITEAEHQIALGNLNSEHQAVIEKINTQNLTFLKGLKNEHKQVIKAWEDDEKELRAELKKSQWLVEEAQEQAENINKFVFWRKAQFAQNIIEDKIYFLLFYLEIYNASLLEISIDEKIGGKILFAGQRLRLEKSLYQTPVIIKPNSVVGFMIKQELDTDEANLIKEQVDFYNKQRLHFHKDMPEGYQFHTKEWLTSGKLIFPPEVELRNLEININGSNNFLPVKSKILTRMDDVKTSIEDFTNFK